MFGWMGWKKTVPSDLRDVEGVYVSTKGNRNKSGRSFARVGSGSYKV